MWKSFNVKFFVVLALTMTFTLMISDFVQDTVLNEVVDTGDVVLGGYGVPLITGTLIALTFYVLWKYVLRQKQLG